MRQARAAHLSWTVIGRRLGVSKQAARTRLAERADPLLVDGLDRADAMELAPRLVPCLERAGAEARADGQHRGGH